MAEGRAREHSGVGQPSRRRWPRRPEVRSALITLRDEECLGKTRDLSAGGVGLEIWGCRPRRGDPVKIAVVFGHTLVQFSGAVCYANPAGRRTSVGIALSEVFPFTRSLPEPAVEESGTTGTPPQPGPPGGRKAPVGVAPTSILPGGLFSPEDAKAMVREAQVVCQVLEDNGIDPIRDWSGALRDFVTRYPSDPHRHLADRELFRAAMMKCYPSRPGSAIRGRIYPAGRPAESPRSDSAVVMVDRFAVATADAEGTFTAEGLPVLDVPVTLPLGLRSDCLRMAGEFAVRLPPCSPDLVRVELPVELVPPADDPLLSLNTLVEELLSLECLGHRTSAEPAEFIEALTAGLPGR